MSTVLPSKLAALPAGVFVIGRAVGDFSLKSVTTAKGKPMQFIEGQVLAGTTFCHVNELYESGNVLYVPKDGEEVRCFVVPDYRANNVFKSSVKFSRPEVVDAKK